MTKKKEQHIIKKILAGEITAFSELIDRHQRMAFTVAMNILKNREEAEEVIQDAFLKAYQHIKDFKGQSSFSTWLYKIVYNTAISKKRLKKPINTPLENSEIKFIEMNQSVDSIKKLELNDRKRFLKKAISKLNDDDKTIVLLYYYKEMPVGDIASITNLSLSNVKIKLHRSRQQLFSELSKLLNKEFSTTF